MLMRIKSSTQSNAYLSGLAVIRRFGAVAVKHEAEKFQSAGAPRRKPTITDRQIEEVSFCAEGRRGRRGEGVTSSGGQGSRRQEGTGRSTLAVIGDSRLAPLSGKYDLRGRQTDRQTDTADFHGTSYRGNESAFDTGSMKSLRKILAKCLSPQNDDLYEVYLLCSSFSLPLSLSLSF